MRTYAIVALGLGLAVLGVRHLTGQGRHGVFIGILLVPLVILGWQEYQWRHHESQYTDVARSLIGRQDVKVHCERAAETMFNANGWEGFVAYNADGSLPAKALLTYDTCQRLTDWLGSDKEHPSREQISAVHVLVHEAMHLAGERNEAVADCSAMQRTASAAEMLGATKTQGQRLAAAYWLQVYPHMRDDYRSAECRPGGALDLDPANPAWP